MSQAVSDCHRQIWADSRVTQRRATLSACLTLHAVRPVTVSYTSSNNWNNHTVMRLKFVCPSNWGKNRRKWERSDGMWVSDWVIVGVGCGVRGRERGRSENMLFGEASGIRLLFQWHSPGDATVWLCNVFLWGVWVAGLRMTLLWGEGVLFGTARVSHV